MGATCQRLGSPRPLWLHCLMARVEMKRLHGRVDRGCPSKVCRADLGSGCAAAWVRPGLAGYILSCPVHPGRTPYSLLRYSKPADHIAPCIPEYLSVLS